MWQVIRVVLISTLTACTLTTNSHPAVRVEISFACPPEDVITVQVAAEAFHTANPDVLVRIIPTTDIRRPIAGGIDGDFVAANTATANLEQLTSQVDSFVFSEQAVEAGPAGQLLDLTPLLIEEPRVVETDFLPGLLTRFRYAGGTWGLPAGTEPAVVFYEPASLKRIGIAPPTPGQYNLPWTWDEFFSLAQSLMIRGNEGVERFGFTDNGYFGAFSVLDERSRLLFDLSSSPPRGALAPELAPAISWYVDLSDRHEVMSRPERRASLLASLRSGKAALAIANALAVGAVTDSSSANGIKIFPLPGRTPLRVTGYFISARTPYPEAAWRWLRFLSERVTPARELPARPGLIANSPISRSLDAESLQVCLFAVEHGLPPIRPSSVTAALETVLDSVFAGTPAPDALALAPQQALTISTGTTRVLPMASTPFPSDTLTQITFLKSSRSQQYPTLAQAFHEAHPDITVKVIDEVSLRVAPSSGRAQTWEVGELIKAGHADCFSWMASVPASERNAFWDLQPLIEVDPSFPLDDYYPQTLALLRGDGHLWGLPAAVTVAVIYYDKAAFDEAGLPYPTAGWTWEQFFATANALASSQGRTQRYGLAIWPPWLELLEAVGGDTLVAALTDRARAHATFRFTASEVVTTASTLASLAKNGTIAVPQTQDLVGAQDEITDLVLSSRVAMWINPSVWQLSLVKSVQGREIGIAPWPSGGSCLKPMVSRAYYIAAQTPHASSCWKWIMFLADHTPADVEGIPPRQSQIASSNFRTQVGIEAQQVFQAALECNTTVAGYADLPGQRYSYLAYFWLEDALQQIIFEEVDALSVLELAQNKAEKYLACLNERSDKDDFDSALHCARLGGDPW